MASELNIPDFLNESANDIHARMLAKAPDNISTIEGDIYWDATRPSAEEKERLLKIQLQNILKMAHTQTATGKYLEYLGECKGLYKNSPTKSIGNIQVTGIPGATILKSKIVGTPSSDERESVQFEVVENVTIDSTGVATVPVKCLTAGAIGNVGPNTVTILFSSIDDVKSITNLEKFTGGTDIEDEEHFRERIIAAEQEDQLSGADSDYERWALEVDGVGSAYVIEEWNGPGTVKVLILDKNGDAATDELINAAKNYIYPDKLPGKNRGGKAPIGATVTIATPSTLKIKVSAKFIFTEGFDATSIFSALKNKISDYLKKIKINGIVNYNAIHTIIGSYILSEEGIEDFDNLTVNNGISNIQLSDQVPVMGEVINVT
ncbi:putative phage protein gp47/JayE [Clostridium beijerinckii]|uniref:baseplate J/gp47 family protein n=1 Tax=Clostridium beijerinckii TaxID=1520 RepID=UPI00149452F7|nr:baseplate J/gp47 family protein [Clostridium beijerinckii]NOW92318.1 putative phage protein gp47/JayE [Clostridium beijerinckii]